MDRNLIEDLHKYFEEKEDLTPDERVFLIQLKDELPNFQMISISREHLAALGFKAEDVDDCDMKTLASKLADDYCTQMFDISLDIIADEGLEIPKHRCPKCWKGASKYDSYNKKFSCHHSCNHEWMLTEPTGRYVLVEFPEDPSVFNDNEIGYDCYNSDDNGARYVPEHLYEAHLEKDPNPKKLMKPICWPESQLYLDLEHSSPSKFEQCELVHGCEQIEEFGDNAIWVPLSIISQ